MQTLITDNLSSYARPVPLPCFQNEQQTSMDVWADGHQVLEQTYDGTRNKFLIQPLVRPIGLLYGFLPLGQPYTIGVNHLTRLLMQFSGSRA